MSQDGRTAPVRSETNFTVADAVRGSVRFKVIDRIGIDDVVVHLVERELFRLTGAGDPGVEIPQNFKDFLIRQNYLEK